MKKYMFTMCILAAFVPTTNALAGNENNPDNPKAKVRRGKIVTPVHIRWMIRRDMPEVLDIEKRSFELPWFEVDFIKALRQRNIIGMVAERGEEVVGFMVYELHRHKLHILNFAVAPGWRGQEIGTQMAEKLQGKLSEQRRQSITVEVRETNLAAQKFFSWMDFRAISVLPDFYEDTDEAAYLMRHRHNPEVDMEERIKKNKKQRTLRAAGHLAANNLPNNPTLDELLDVKDGITLKQVISALSKHKIKTVSFWHPEIFGPTLDMLDWLVIDRSIEVTGTLKEVDKLKALLKNIDAFIPDTKTPLLQKHQDRLRILVEKLDGIKQAISIAKRKKSRPDNALEDYSDEYRDREPFKIHIPENWGKRDPLPLSVHITGAVLIGATYLLSGHLGQDAVGVLTIPIGAFGAIYGVHMITDAGHRLVGLGKTIKSKAHNLKKKAIALACKENFGKLD